MSDKHRVHINFDDDEQIDLADLTNITSHPKPTQEQHKKIIKEAEKVNFVSREPRRRRKSPYTAQFGGKCRVGMKSLFQEIGERLDCYDTETLELAILALIEKEKLDELKEKYEELTKK